MAVAGFKNHDYLQSRWVELSEENQKELAGCITSGKDKKFCFEAWNAAENSIASYLNLSYVRLDAAISGILIALALPALLWISFFAARWIRTGSLRRSKESG